MADIISLSSILKRIRAAFPKAVFQFLHPSLYVVCIDPSFEGLTEEHRLALAATKIDIDGPQLEIALSAVGFVLALVTDEEFKNEYEFLRTAPSSRHWIEFLADPSVRPNEPSSVPVVHFYGFKGGQGRSTVLAMMAKHLANDGYRVLVVDADLEAPSLQTVFGGSATKIESTLFGCVRFDLTPSPEAVYVPKSDDGRVDLLACRPADRDFDLDFANFALRSALDPSVLEQVFKNLVKSAESQYDVILFDHRTGLSASVIPIVASFPGPVVICLRLDEQSDNASSYFDVLLRLNPPNPGLFVSFSLNPEETYEQMLVNHREKIESLLEGITDGLQQRIGNRIANSGDSDSDEADADELINRWVKWYHDPNFLTKHLPAVSEILTTNQKSLSTVRDLLGLAARKKSSAVTGTKTHKISASADLTGSGNTDDGPLIEADALRHLRIPSTPYTYILGRKGTGKTRLLRALAEEARGQPMLVAEDFPLPNGILSSDTLLADLAAQLKDDPAKLWWVLLDAVVMTSEREHQQRRLREILKLIEEKGPSAYSTTAIRDRVIVMPEMRVLLVDGVETAFDAHQTSAFVEGLFRFLSTVQSDASISQKLTIRLFIRTDLVEGARENIEQQIEKRVIRLAWDTQTILNFVLARIASIGWFQDQFSGAVAAINERASELIRGAVSEDDCGQLLLRIFPERMRRNNTGMLTFLKTYFSDGEGDRASFYPRIYDSFLRFIAEGGSPGNLVKRTQLEGGLVAHDLIFEAHAQACKDYLEQVKDELKNLLNLAPTLNENKQRISEMLGSYNGMTTPFEVEPCIRQLFARLNETVPDSTLRQAMQQMKKIGIFEDRPGYPGHWRVGRLFKSSLGMRYNRKRKGED